MKKLSFFKKIIIVLITCIIVFNVAMPKPVYAWDVGGVLFKPLFSVILLGIDSVNFLMSATLLGGGAWVDDEGKKSDDNLLLSPEMIFDGTVTLLNANIFEAEIDDSYFKFDSTFTSGVGSSLGGALKKTVASIYEILRNFCAIVLLVMLIYTGIRIVLASASATEKKEWQTKLIDWVKALLLLLFIHLIMIGMFSLCNILMDAFKNTEGLNMSAQLSKAGWTSFTFMQQLIFLILFGYTTYLTIVFGVAYFKRLVWVMLLITIAPYSLRPAVTSTASKSESSTTTT